MDWLYAPPWPDEVPSTKFIYSWNLLLKGQKLAPILSFLLIFAWPILITFSLCPSMIKERRQIILNYSNENDFSWGQDLYMCLLLSEDYDFQNKKFLRFLAYQFQNITIIEHWYIVSNLHTVCYFCMKRVKILVVQAKVVSEIIVSHEERSLIIIWCFVL